MLNTEKNFSGFFLIWLFIFVLFVSSSNLYAAGESFWLYTNDEEAYYGGVSFGFYPSGYSDGWYWGYSENKHEYGSHETLSGEWAAAIYFSGIQNNESMWLTDWFSYPDLAENMWKNQAELNGITGIEFFRRCMAVFMFANSL